MKIKVKCFTWEYLFLFKLFLNQPIPVSCLEVHYDRVLKKKINENLELVSDQTFEEAQNC